MTTLSPADWNTQLTTHNGHLLQSWSWGELKSNFGWTAHRIQTNNAAAQILFKQLPLGFTIAYIPKGPMVNWQNSEQCETLFETIHATAKKQRAVFLKIEPDIWQSTDPDLTGFKNMSGLTGFTPADTIQPQSTIFINISGSEDDILAAMKQKTRYNIRLAKKKGVIIRQGTEADISTFHNLSLLTSDRDEFGVHSLEYYQQAYSLFTPNNCALFIAEFEDEPLAALMAFSQGTEAYYFFGASSNTHRNLMPTYLIQWEAIRWAKAQGCTRYDLWGIPNENVDTLETEFKQRSDGLWGVYRFKRGFGGQVEKSIGAFDYVYNPLLYKLYKLRRGV